MVCEEQPGTVNPRLGVSPLEKSSADWTHSLPEESILNWGWFKARSPPPGKKLRTAAAKLTPSWACALGRSGLTEKTGHGWSQSFLNLPWDPHLRFSSQAKSSRPRIRSPEWASGNGPEMSLCTHFRQQRSSGKLSHPAAQMVTGQPSLKWVPPFHCTIYMHGHSEQNKGVLHGTGRFQRYLEGCGF